MKNYIIFSLMIMAGIALVYILAFYITRKIDNKIHININDKNTKMFKNELDRMILYHTIYQIDVTFGNTFRDRKAVSPDIENSDISDAVDTIKKYVMEDMSDLMKEYLYTVFGKQWIYDYINIQTLSLALNYTRISVMSLTKNLFK